MPTEPVYLGLAPPDREGLVSLLIYEAPDNNPLTPCTLIETVTEIGTYPDYISQYTTQLALHATDWFSIEWEDAEGAKTLMSQRIQGSTRTILAEVVNRVMERDRGLSKSVVAQEAEGVIQWYYGDDKNPYESITTDEDMPSFRVLNGLAYMTIANLKAVELSVLMGEQNNVSIGVVSMRTSGGSKVSADYVKALVQLAYGNLGYNASTVMQLDCARNLRSCRAIELIEP